MGEKDFEECYGSLRARISRFYPRASADDVVQQAYCEAISVLRASPEGNHPGALLWTIAKRAALKQVRDRIRRSQYADDPVNLDEVPSPDDEPWSIVADREDYSRLQEVLSSMRRTNPKDHDLLMDRYLHGHSSAQLAEQFSTTRQAVKARLYRVRKKLRNYFSSCDASEEARR